MVLSAGCASKTVTPAVPFHHVDALGSAVDALRRQSCCATFSRILCLWGDVGGGGGTARVWDSGTSPVCCDVGPGAMGLCHRHRGTLSIGTDNVVVQSTTVVNRAFLPQVQDWSA